MRCCMSRCFYCNARVHNEFTCSRCDAVMCSQRCASIHSKKMHAKKASKFAALGCGIPQEKWTQG